MNMASAFLGAHPTLVQMGHRKSLGFIRTSWFSWFLRVGLVWLAVFARVTSQDKVAAPPSNLFCISECGTCPVICSPPPPPLLTYFPPPSPVVPRSPPPEVPLSPPPEVPHSPPPLYFAYPPPLPKSPASPPPPPPPTPSTHSSGAAPPPPSKSYNVPPSGSGQPTVISGPNEYSYPYYYFYASDASSPSSHAPFLLLLLFLHRVFFCW